jgi:hypothetical protein
LLSLFFLLAWPELALSEQTIDINPEPFLNSPEFLQMKAEYQSCVLQRGAELTEIGDFELAMTYAPLACRRDLLKIKRMMLGSAFKVEVAEDLLASIAEGVEIDLVNFLLDKKLNREGQ